MKLKVVMDFAGNGFGIMKLQYSASGIQRSEIALLAFEGLTAAFRWSIIDRSLWY